MSQETELTALSLAQAAALIQARALAPGDLTEAYLGRIARLNPAINAYITVTAERARDDARRAADELAAGVYRGPLHGIPIALKDLFATAGIRTTGGSKIHAHWVPATDSAVARKLREAGWARWEASNLSAWSVLGWPDGSLDRAALRRAERHEGLRG